MEYLVKNLTRFSQKSKKIHFWKKRISKMLVEMDFIPTFYFRKKFIVYLFSVIFFVRLTSLL